VNVSPHPKGPAGSPGGASDVLVEAIRARRKVSALCHGDLVVFCPHTLARRADGRYVLAFLFSADGMPVADKLSSPRRWRWLPLDHLTDVASTAGGWYTGRTGPRPVLAGAHTEVDVPEAEAAE
jgi:hypothetical protein